MPDLAPFARRFHYPFRVDPNSGRISEEPDYDAYVKQLMLQVLLTARGERINRPDFGAGTRRLVFKPLSEASSMLAKTLVYEALTRWLSTLIVVEEVSTRIDESTLYLDVTFTVIAHGQQRYLNEKFPLR